MTRSPALDGTASFFSGAFVSPPGTSVAFSGATAASAKGVSFSGRLGASAGSACQIATTRAATSKTSAARGARRLSHAPWPL